MNNCEYHEVMIDLETLALTPDAHILSIGACDISNPETTFYHTVEGTGQNRTTNYSTIKWWLRQSPEAIKAATSRDCVLELTDMLHALSAFIEAHAFTHPWAQGCAFDIVILENAYKQHVIKVP